MKKLLHFLLLLLAFLKKSVLYNWRPKPKHYKRNAFLHDQIVVLKKKSFCLDNFTSSDENMVFYTGLDTGRFQVLCGLIEAGEKGENVEWYRADKKLYKDLGLEDMR